MPTLFDQPRRTHPNSRKAHAEEGPRLSKRAAAILANVREHGPGSDKAIAARMWFSHRSAVQPRISDLVKMGLLVECGEQVDSETGKTVRVVGVPR